MDIYGSATRFSKTAGHQNPPVFPLLFKDAKPFFFDGMIVDVRLWALARSNSRTFRGHSGICGFKAASGVTWIWRAILSRHSKIYGFPLSCLNDAHLREALKKSNVLLRAIARRHLRSFHRKKKKNVFCIFWDFHEFQ